MRIFYLYDSRDKIKRAYAYHRRRATKIKLKSKKIESYIVFYGELNSESIICGREDLLVEKIETHLNSKIDFGIRRKFDKIIKCKYSFGEFHPRIHRPIITKVDPDWEDLSGRKNTKLNRLPKYDGLIQLLRPINFELLNPTINQIELITNELIDIFQTLHPSKRNLKSFGHKIRNLFIIACTEVEAQLKGIYSSNERRKKNRYSTRDYVKLLPYLRLNEYKIRLNQYPKIEPLSPFSSWDSESPTKSLQWYNDYNSVKHDRENEFHKSTLINLLNSISAIVILCYAQFGKDNLYMRNRIGYFYKLESEPKWEDEECYFPPIGKDYKWKTKKLLL